MQMLPQASRTKAGWAINLPALLIVALAHGAMLTGAVSTYPGEGSSFPSGTASIQVSLLPLVSSPPEAPSAVPSAVPVQEPGPVPRSASPATAAPPNDGMPVVYYPASALSRMPEVDGLFDVPLPPGPGLNGQIELRLWIDAAGTLDRIAVQSSQVPALYQQAAVAAFQRLRYRPGQIGDRPVAAFVDLVVEMQDTLSSTPSSPY